MTAAAPAQHLTRSLAHACAQRLITGGCRRGWVDCLQPPAFDHGSLWLRDRRPYALVFEPYGLQLEQLGALVAFCNRHKLKLQIDGASRWYPGSTIRIMLTRADGPAVPFIDADGKPIGRGGPLVAKTRRNVASSSRLAPVLQLVRPTWRERE